MSFISIIYLHRSVGNILSLLFLLHRYAEHTPGTYYLYYYCVPCVLWWTLVKILFAFKNDFKTSCCKTSILLVNTHSITIEYTRISAPVYAYYTLRKTIADKNITRAPFQSNDGPCIIILLYRTYYYCIIRILLLSPTDTAHRIK